MSLAHGGHLTHGAKVNFSGKIFNAVQYGVTDDGVIDYDKLEAQALECKPTMIVAGFSAYARHLDFPRFRAIADKVGALLFVNMTHVAGLVAAGLYPSPLPFADIVTSTTHKTLRGPRGGIILGRANADIEKKIASMVFPGTQGGPLMHVIAAKAVAFKEALEPAFKEYQRQVLANTRAMAGVFIERGYKIVSGGTDDHLFLVDLIAHDPFHGSFRHKAFLSCLSTAGDQRCRHAHGGSGFWSSHKPIRRVLASDLCRLIASAIFRRLFRGVFSIPPSQSLCDLSKSCVQRGWATRTVGRWNHHLADNSPIAIPLVPFDPHILVERQARQICLGPAAECLCFLGCVDPH